jgi:hypothetical protein
VEGSDGPTIIIINHLDTPLSPTPFNSGDIPCTRCVRLCIPCKARVALTKGQKPPSAEALLLATPMVDLAINRAKCVPWTLCRLIGIYGSMHALVRAPTIP